MKKTLRVLPAIVWRGWHSRPKDWSWLLPANKIKREKKEKNKFNFFLVNDHFTWLFSSSLSLISGVVTSAKTSQSSMSNLQQNRTINNLFFTATLIWKWKMTLPAYFSLNLFMFLDENLIPRSCSSALGPRSSNLHVLIFHQLLFKKN